MKAYHGTNVKFDEFRQDKARIMDDYYGGGVAYFTDNETVAKSYAKNNSKKSGVPYVYEVEINIKKVFDVDHEFTGKELTQFFDSKTVKDFAIGAKLARLGGDDIYTVMVRLEDGKYKLTGDTIFKALSGGMVRTSKARDKLISLGYNCLRYNGGVQSQSAIRHNVYCMYNAKDIKMLGVQSLLKQEETNLQEKIHIPASHLNISREHMPQIAKDWLDSFLSELRLNRIEFKQEKIDTKKLKATQSEFSKTKIEKRLRKGSAKDRPIIVSNDDYVLDGHHRWLAELNLGIKKINAIVVNLPILDLIAMAKNFMGVHYRDVNDTIHSLVREHYLDKERSI